MPIIEPKGNPTNTNPPTSTNLPATNGVVKKPITSILLAIGILLILASTIVPLLLEHSKTMSESASLWYGVPGFFIGAICLLIVLTSTENKGEATTAKVFLIMPFLLISLASLFLWPLSIIFIAIAIPAIILFIKVDRNQHVIIKVLAWLTGISVYVVIGFAEVLLINPPSIFYGTPMYRPKTK